MLASQRRVGSPRTYPCPSSRPSNSLTKGCSQATRWRTVSCPKKCGPSRSLYDQYTAPGGATTTPALRWELFRSRNLEGEKLPPTRATLISHILCTNTVGMRDKSYTTSHPCLLLLEEMGGCLPETRMSQSGISTN